MPNIKVLITAYMLGMAAYAARPNLHHLHIFAFPEAVDTFQYHLLAFG